MGGQKLGCQLHSANVLERLKKVLKACSQKALHHFLHQQRPPTLVYTMPAASKAAPASGPSAKPKSKFSMKAANVGRVGSGPQRSDAPSSSAAAAGAGVKRKRYIPTAKPATAGKKFAEDSQEESEGDEEGEAAPGVQFE